MSTMVENAGHDALLLAWRVFIGHPISGAGLMEGTPYLGVTVPFGWGQTAEVDCA